MDCLSGAQYFTKIDLKSGYDQIWIREGGEWKTTFKTKEGLNEWLVMPFGMTSASSTFMRLMNEVLKIFLGNFVIVYLDDILIFRKSLDEQLLHIRSVLEMFKEDKLLINLKKCRFVKKELVYLGSVEEKVNVILEWPTPRYATEVRSFHGLASFYKKFIKNFSCFELLKKKVTEKPMLELPNFIKVF